jgi:hypothetical protein
MKVHRMKETKWLGGGLRRKGAEELRCAAEVEVNAISRESCVPLNSQEDVVSKRLDYLEGIKTVSYPFSCKVSRDLDYVSVNSNLKGLCYEIDFENVDEN